MDSTTQDAASQYFRTFTEELLSEWSAWRFEQNPFHVKEHETDPSAYARFSIVFGLACQAHDAARGYLSALAEAPAAATPLARFCFELGMTAQWISQIPDAYAAVANRHLQNQATLEKDLRAAEDPVFHPFADMLADSFSEKNLEKLPTTSAGSAKNFKQLCEDLEDAADYYLQYRFQSSESHAGLSVSSQWINSSEPEAGIRMQLRPTERDEWLALVTVSLLWAESAIDCLDATHERRTYLDEVAARLGCPRELPPSEKAMRRLRKRGKN
ncbi:DUF5677 domain-containing protein [Kocuria turfanensis]|uniref:DUF5677 domain-containing protein n=1 Tax=Kocuria turfanensis TaxID=388357 RepID=UPI000B280DC1|nr:DUF5677 domain-containing protein [Kocuria turfanensis]